MVAVDAWAHVARTPVVVSEGRWEAGNFRNMQKIPVDLWAWDHATNESNDNELRGKVLDRQGGPAG